MTYLLPRWRPLLLLLLLAAPFARAQTPSSTWKQDLLQWRSQRAASLTRPDSWLSLVGLQWIKPGDNSFGSAADNNLQLPGDAPAHIGILHLSDNLVTLGPPAHGFPAGLMVNGQAAVGGVLNTSDDQPTQLTVGTLVLYVIQRGDRYYLRVKDALAPTLINFSGLQWYPPDRRYRIHAKWTPYNPPLKRTVLDVLGISMQVDVPGVAEFTLDGQQLQLEPLLEQPGDKQLFFLFRDHTSRTATYGAGRFLYSDLPDHGLDQPGTITLDFNRAVNPPCAYTAYATCPVPPQQNRLPVAIPAGEKRYHE